MLRQHKELQDEWLKEILREMEDREKILVHSGLQRLLIEKILRMEEKGTLSIWQIVFQNGGESIEL